MDDAQEVHGFVGKASVTALIQDQSPHLISSRARGPHHSQLSVICRIFNSSFVSWLVLRRGFFRIPHQRLRLRRSLILEVLKGLNSECQNLTRTCETKPMMSWSARWESAPNFNVFKNVRLSRAGCQIFWRRLTMKSGAACSGRRASSCRRTCHSHCGRRNLLAS